MVHPKILNYRKENVYGVHRPRGAEWNWKLLCVLVKIKINLRARKRVRELKEQTLCLKCSEPVDGDYSCCKNC